MAATSSTRRRGRPRTTDTGDRVTVSISRRIYDNFLSARRRLAEATMSLEGAIFGSAIAEIETTQNLTTGLAGMPAADKQRRNRTTRRVARSRETVGTPSAPQQTRRARGRPRTANRNARARAGALDLATLSRDTTATGRVYNALPPIGGSATINDLASLCGLRAQDVGGALNRLQKAGVVRRSGPRREIVTTERLAQQRAA